MQMSNESFIEVLVGGFKPSEKYESQLGWFFPIYGKIIQSCSSHHQPELMRKLRAAVAAPLRHPAWCCNLRVPLVPRNEADSDPDPDGAGWGEVLQSPNLPILHQWIRRTKWVAVNLVAKHRFSVAKWLLKKSASDFSSDSFQLVAVWWDQTLDHPSFFQMIAVEDHLAFTL